MLEGSLYALVASSIVLVYKATHVVSLAHGQLLAFGALFFYLFLVPLALHPLISIILACLSMAVLGFLVERLALRPLIGQPLFTSFLVTFSLYMVFDGVYQFLLEGQALAYTSYLPEGVLKFGEISLPVGQLISFMVSMALFASLALFYKFTKSGLGMRAASENHRLAQGTGIIVKRIFSLIWIISAVVATIGGVAIANIMDIHYPLPNIGIKGLIVALFGGLESLPGALLAGLLLGIIENLGAGYLDPLVGGGIREVAAYVMLLIILLVKPYGLMGLVKIERI